MRGQVQLLVNTPEIELWPGGLLRARSNHDARALARARHVLRRKHDGRYLAADLPDGLLPLVAHLRREPGIDDALRALAIEPARARPGIDVVPTLPLHRLQARLGRLGIDSAAYAERTGLALVAEPAWLAFAGPDRFRSEEHTSELQSLMRISYAVFCLTKKIKVTHNHTKDIITTSTTAQ